LVGAGVTTIASVSGTGDPIIAVAPRGPGRLLISGALDAWRYRAANNAAIVAGLAAAAPRTVDVEIVPNIISAGESARVSVRVHGAALEPAPGGALKMSARLDTGEPVRLWPDAGE